KRLYVSLCALRLIFAPLLLVLGGGSVRGLVDVSKSGSAVGARETLQPALPTTPRSLGRSVRIRSAPGAPTIRRGYRSAASCARTRRAEVSTRIDRARTRETLRSTRRLFRRV